MTTAATRSLGWRTPAALPMQAPWVRARHNDRMWMGKQLISYDIAELREILFALEITAYGHVTATEHMPRHDLIDACGEVDAELEQQRSRKAS